MLPVLTLHPWTHPLSPPSLFSGHIDLLAAFWTCQEYSHLRTFTLAVASVCSALFSDTHMAQFPPFILPKCHLIREPSLNTFRIALAYLAVPLYPFIFILSSYYNLKHYVSIRLLFAHYISALECKLHENRNFILFTTVFSTSRKMIVIEKGAQKIFPEYWIRNVEGFTIVSFSTFKLHEICLKAVYFSISTSHVFFLKICLNFLFWNNYKLTSICIVQGSAVYPSPSFPPKLPQI